VKEYVYILISVTIILSLCGCIWPFGEKDKIEPPPIRGSGITDPPKIIPPEDSDSKSSGESNKQFNPSSVPEKPKILYSIIVKVFDDVNGNGDPDDESGQEMSDWSVSIQGDGITTLKKLTGSNGSYNFNNLPAGNYQVCVNGKECCGKEKECWILTSDTCQNVALENEGYEIEFGAHMLPQNVRIDRSALNAGTKGHATSFYPGLDLYYKFWIDGDPVSGWTKSSTMPVAALGQRNKQICVIDTALIGRHEILKDSCNCIST
jgi:hypothetical protein